MKKFAIQSVLLLVVIVVALFMVRAPNTPELPFLPQVPKSRQVIINNHKFDVEVADTQEKRKIGLGRRESLASDAGMLFVFEKPAQTSFWMKGLKFPLDFIYIRGSYVVDILENAKPPLPEQTDEQLPIYQPKEEVDKVLEVNGGVVGKLGIKVGDNIEIR